MTIPAVYRPGFTPLRNLYVALDGLSLPGTDTNGTQWWLTDFDGWYGTPDVRLGTVDRVQDHGQDDGPTFYAARSITAQGTSIAPSQETALLCCDILASLCSDPALLYPMQVTEPGRPVRRCEVRLGAATKVSALYGKAFDWQFQILAPDPVRYSETQIVQPFTVPTGATGGLTVPLTVPLTISTSGVSGSTATVTNAGPLASRKFVVTISGPLVDPQIAHLGSGRTLALNITLVAGDTLVVDFYARTVTLNGTASRSTALATGAAWWELDPGPNDIAFTAGGGTGGAVLTGRSAWP